jgi:hypothetical protein
LKTPKGQLPPSPDIIDGRSFDRLVNFTDAIVAVAITVLVLPLVALRPRSGETTVWDVINDNTGQLATFMFTFIVVAMMWRIHNRVFRYLAGFDGTIFWLNATWLLLIVFLPWSSSMYGTGIDGFSATAQNIWFSGGEGLGGAGVLYWWNLALLSFIGGAIIAYARRRPALISKDAPEYFQNWSLGRSDKSATGRSYKFTRTRGFVFGVYMFLIGVATLFIPTIAIWLPFGLFFIGFIYRRQEN